MKTEEVKFRILFFYYPKDLLNELDNIKTKITEGYSVKNGTNFIFLEFSLKFFNQSLSYLIRNNQFNNNFCQLMINFKDHLKYSLIIFGKDNWYTYFYCLVKIEKIISYYVGQIEYLIQKNNEQKKEEEIRKQQESIKQQQEEEKTRLYQLHKQNPRLYPHPNNPQKTPRYQTCPPGWYLTHIEETGSSGCKKNVHEPNSIKRDIGRHLNKVEKSALNAVSSGIGFLQNTGKEIGKASNTVKDTLEQGLQTARGTLTSGIDSLRGMFNFKFPPMIKGGKI